MSFRTALAAIVLAAAALTGHRLGSVRRGPAAAAAARRRRRAPECPGHAGELDRPCSRDLRAGSGAASDRHPGGPAVQGPSRVPGVPRAFLGAHRAQYGVRERAVRPVPLAPGGRGPHGAFRRPRDVLRLQERHRVRAGSPAVVSCGAGEAGCRAWASSMALEAARPRRAMGLWCSAMRSRAAGGIVDPRRTSRPPTAARTRMRCCSRKIRVWAPALVTAGAVSCDRAGLWAVAQPSRSR